MYSTFKGNTASSAVSELVSADAVIKYLIITNKSGAVVTINLKIRGTDDVQVCPLNLQLSKDESYTDRELVVLSTDRIVVEATGSVDYYFSIIADGNYTQKR